ncbi:MAG: hypothetical protein H0X73_07795 [Chthoniobacterales bacterium]|nr:hypothetical protein [Chthoniobacterales bacterium]
MQKLLCLLLLCGSVIIPAASFATTVNFDANPATGLFTDKTAQDVVTNTAVTITGGVILDQGKFEGAATTNPNLYATTDFLVPYLPAVITGVFNVPVSFLQLDVFNGLFGGSFTLTGYGGAGEVLDTDTVSLAAFGHPGFVGHLSISGSGFTAFSVRSGQTLGLVDFGIDTVNFTSASSVPETSGTLTLMGLSLAALGVLASRRTHRIPEGSVVASVAG